MRCREDSGGQNQLRFSSDRSMKRERTSRVNLKRRILRSNPEDLLTVITRRDALAATAAGAVAAAAMTSAANAAPEKSPTSGNPDQPAEGAVNVTNPKALTDRSEERRVGKECKTTGAR